MPKPRDVPPVLFESGASVVSGHTQAGEAGHVFRTSSPGTLLLAAGLLRMQAQAASNPKRARAFRTTELVAREREQIHTKVRYRNRNLADGLDGVGVTPGAMCSGDGRNLSHGLQGTDFVVRVHHADQRGITTRGGRERCVNGSR